jgi:alpha-mannosidase
MEFTESLDSALRSVAASEVGAAALVQRIRAQIGFAHGFAGLHPNRKAEWEKLILKAAELVRDRLSAPGPADLAAIVAEAENVMAPIGKAAKEFTIHCCGHAHIDMNWLWPWQDTISVTHDTFATVDRLMDEFPDFHFSQSQASTYLAMEEYCPEIFEMVVRRIKEGRWEPTASMWVEGDKNMASGEILCRHILYTRRYFKERFGLPYDGIKIAWECDTFGHAHTLPSILNRGGVSRYYRHRTNPEHWLIWWQAPDGSKVLAFFDRGTYNGEIEPRMADLMLDYVKETGLKDFLYLYGVGDHGGGPTRRDLMAAGELDSWPIFPNVRLSTTDRYFSAVEKVADKVPVHNGELNFVFEGCYTSQSSIKTANRVSENILPEVEAISLVAGAAARFPYPAEHILKGWRLAMFNQFHDILPGSGIHATYEYAQGLFQEVQAIAGAIRTRALRKLASEVNTSAASGVKPPTGGLGASVGDGIGAGAGDTSIPGGVSAYNVGAVSAEPFIIFNQMPFPRSEMVMAKVWNKDFLADRIAVRDDAGNVTAGQVTKTGDYWGHKYAAVLFPAKDVPGMGYRTYTVSRAAAPVKTEGVKVAPSGYDSWLEIVSPVVMENKYVRVEMDMASGAIKHLIDKASGYDLVPDGELMGVLELCQEAPRGMSAWEIGQIARVTRLDHDGKLEILHRGPHRAAVSTSRGTGDSRISVEVGLAAGSPMVDFTVTAFWLERGTKETGVPMLRIAFPTRISKPRATYEISFGSIERPTNGHEVPALKWADLSGERVGAAGSCGITLVNADKYGHSAEGSTLRLTLLRSSFDPDPLPEMGEHVIRLAIAPHDGLCSVSAAARAGSAFNLPMNVVSTDVHEGRLPPSKGFVEVLTPNVMLAAIKKAEDSDAIIVRLYETEGRDTEARVRITDLVKPGSPAREVDLMEQPLQKNTARMERDTLVVRIPAHGIATVAAG